MVTPKKSSKLQSSKTEWQERVVAIQRVTKVVKGGKKMSFRAVVVVGNEQGKVGVGVGKAGDVINAVKNPRLIVLNDSVSNSIDNPF